MAPRGEGWLTKGARGRPGGAEAVRVELAGKAASQETWDPMAMCQGMMEKMKAGGNPMAIFREMAEKKKGKCC
jgi:hypothetical protein